MAYVSRPSIIRSASNKELIQYFKDYNKHKERGWSRESIFNKKNFALWKAELDRRKKAGTISKLAGVTKKSPRTAANMGFSFKNDLFRF